jgi:hypothetical protein
MIYEVPDYDCKLKWEIHISHFTYYLYNIRIVTYYLNNKNVLYRITISLTLLNLLL